ncbi:MAG TPA: NAD(+)/NADH kinase [Bryobacteraceae bacterium]|nr:NAD(+)/NADH kinase [Bryobacteraceae bacterium]
MPTIRKVGVMSKPGIAHASTIVADLIEWLHGHGIEVRCDEQTASYAGLTDGLSREHVADGTELVIVLGGDGTLLSAARSLEGREIPLFPVNLGGLGFLTAITLDELYPQLERALRGEQRIARRRMLRCELFRDGDLVAGFEALNDVVITKTEIARMIDLETFVDDHFVSRFKADGLIICTPTGSTAYSLSAGGPIIFPAVEAFCITPICPHMLTNRPVLVPDTSLIQIINLAKDRECYLTIDGQVGEPLRSDDKIVCRSSGHSVALVRPPQMLFFDVLRQKLKWGER